VAMPQNLPTKIAGRLWGFTPCQTSSDINSRVEVSIYELVIGFAQMLHHNKPYCSKVCYDMQYVFYQLGTYVRLFSVTLLTCTSVTLSMNMIHVNYPLPVNMFLYYCSYSWLFPARLSNPDSKYQLTPSISLIHRMLNKSKVSQRVITNLELRNQTTLIYTYIRLM
jgi:hypothetical protein